MKKPYAIVLLILAINFINTVYGQKIQTVSATAVVKLEDHLSREETRQMAREQARHKALETKYGTFVSKDARVEVEDGNTAVYITGATQVKGEWLETVKESFKEEIRRVKTSEGPKTEIWISCTVKGRAREITDASVQFDFHTMSCPEIACSADMFENNAQLYLYFKSPVDGFLSVFLADEKQAYRILPYHEMPEKYIHNVPVKADREYIFFNPVRSADYFEGFPYYFTDEIVLDTEDDQTAYELYVVLSSKPYTKPLLEKEVELAGDYKNPKHIPREDFDKWVRNNRIVNEQFFYQTSNLIVKK